MNLSVMNYFLSTLILMSSFFAAAQTPSQRLEQLIDFVQKMDSVSNKNSRTFSLLKIGKENTSLKESWNYALFNGKPAVFSILYTIDSIEYNEVYYMLEGNLVCTEEYHTQFYSIDQVDELKFGSILYFNNFSILQSIRLGTDRMFTATGFHRGDLSSTTQQRFQNRYKELKENMIYR